MALFSRRDWRDDLTDDVAHHLRRLRREVASLRSGAEHSAHDAGRAIGHVAHDLGETLADTGSAAVRSLGRKAVRAGKAVRRDPLPTVVGIIGLACLASLILSDGGSSRR